MLEALAHETLFPHVHPHPQMSTVENLVLTVLFLGFIFLIGRLFLAAFRRLTTNVQQKSSDRTS
jgi:hypothetical protein